MEELFLGFDVGTGSVRVGAFGKDGSLKGKAEHQIEMWTPQPNFVEQSSEDIWEATCRATKGCLLNGKIDPSLVKGISFDATCSLVALGEGFAPISISPTGNDHQNIIVWMDHRAIGQAARINATGHDVLQYVGGKISPEMEPPKLMWIKENLPGTYHNARKFMDLADYMVFRATGNDMRSMCTTVCKWTYLGHEAETGGYRADFFQEIGLEDLFENDRVPPKAYNMGKMAGGLTKKAAHDLGLPENVAVGVGIIDAHAGGIGSLGSVLLNPEPEENPFDRAIALIGGTSSCHMGVSPAPRFISGVWGPYFGAMVPGMWLNEGGQSATGSLIDMVIESSPTYPELTEAAREAGVDIYAFLNRLVGNLKEKGGVEITSKLHMLPYHHGNRSPRADPEARGMVSGVTLSHTIEDGALLYYTTMQAIAYGTRHIIEVMNESGYSINRIHFCGGHSKNELFLQENADITGCDLILPREPEAVLLGTAILGAVAAGVFEDIPEGMKSMCRVGRVIHPDPSTAAYHGSKYEIFKEMYTFQKRIHGKMKKWQKKEAAD
jgi:FGGY-family pentulose kinase